ncbi:hypothetical protein L2E82_12376 [Cichorium intybus]|uniref:Uncharacterized protein n=1 Tax=Cichorium intybus TaxID=13427 RepID=A0ACB9GFS2_CICIN|nr:hypothetical protein L2E82_12376 [Cichorium intybus]
MFVFTGSQSILGYDRNKMFLNWLNQILPIDEPQPLVAHDPLYTLSNLLTPSSSSPMSLYIHPSIIPLEFYVAIWRRSEASEDN